MTQKSHEELEKHLLQLEINKNTNTEELIQILGKLIGTGDIVGVAMINMFIRNNNIKLQNVLHP